nr:MAG TPA: Minor tail protein [Caudoviricetes sp.]
MADKVDSITLEIEATTQKADKGIDKTIESLKAMKTALNGINTKKLRQEMESFEDFQKKLQTVFSNIKVSGNTEELRKQITQAEARLDTLLSKENKLKTVSGIDENSKQYRNLQYDIADVCNTLDQLYAAMDKVNAQKPLNFWEKPNWAENLQNYGTTDESIIKSRLGSVEDVEKVESVATYAANNIKQSFAETAQTETEAAQNVQKLGGKMQTLKGIAEQLKTAFSGIREKISLGSGAEKFNADMQDLIDGMNQAKHTMKQMESGAKAFDSTAYERAAQELAEASEQMRNYKNSLTGATEQTSRLKTVISGIGGVVKGAFAKLGSIGSGVIVACKKAAGALRSLKSQIPKLGAAFNGLGKKIRSVTRLFAFMVLRRAITALLNTMKQGFDTLAQYSEAKGAEFNKNISAMQSGLKQLGNSIIAAFEPLINAVTPIINAFISKLIEATNAIGQFFAALTGKSTFTHAKKVVGNYAESLDKATASTKKLATATAGIDELNILQDNNNDNGGGSGATNPADSFETEKVGDKFANLAQMIKDAWGKADFSEIGAMVAEKINAALEGIDWAKIKETSKKIAQSIGTFINGFVGALDWSLVGSTIGEGINTALIFANTLLITIDWGMIGRSLATGLNSAVNVIDWPAVGSLVCNGFNSIIDLLYDFVSTFDFTNLGESIGTAITTAIKGIKWSKGGATIGLSMSGLLDTFIAFVDTTDFAQIGQSIVNAVGGFFENLSWGSIGESLSGAFKALLDFISGTVSGVSWDKVPKYIIDAIKDFFTGFDWSGVSESLGKLLGSAVKGALDLVGSIWDMLKKSWGNLSDYFNVYIQNAGEDIIAGLWNGIKNALKNCGTWIKNNLFQPFIDGFKTAFQIHSPSREMQTMGGYIVEGLISGISGKFSGCQAKVLEWAGKIKDWFSGTSFGKICKSTWETYGQNIIGGFKDKIGGAYSTTKDNISAWAENVKKWFSGTSFGAINKDTWITYANDVISGFRTKIGNTYTSTRDNISAWAADIKSYFSGSSHGAVNSTTFSTYAHNIINGFKGKISTSYSDCQSSITTWASNVKTWFSDTASASAFRGFAKNIIDGFANGINSFYKDCENAVKSWASKVSDWFKEKLDINSPSKVFEQFGFYTVQGFNKGIDTAGESTKKAVSGWLAPFDNVSINPRLSINDAALKDYWVNYGEDFNRDISVQRYTHNSISGAVQAAIVADNPLTAAFKEIAETVIVPAIQNVETQAKRQADKNEQTIVEIGGRTITNAVREQKSRNGFSFQPT